MKINSRNFYKLCRLKNMYSCLLPFFYSVCKLSKNKNCNRKAPSLYINIYDDDCFLDQFCNIGFETKLPL